MSNCTIPIANTINPNSVNSIEVNSTAIDILDYNTIYPANINIANVLGEQTIEQTIEDQYFLHSLLFYIICIYILLFIEIGFGTSYLYNIHCSVKVFKLDYGIMICINAISKLFINIFILFFKKVKKSIRISKIIYIILMSSKILMTIIFSTNYNQCKNNMPKSLSDFSLAAIIIDSMLMLIIHSVFLDLLKYNMLS